MSSESALERRVEELAAALATVERRLGEPQSDSLSPNTVTINQKGETEEILSGKLTTQAIIFPTLTPQAYNAITWEDYARIYGSAADDGGTMGIQALSSGEGPVAIELINIPEAEEQKLIIQAPRERLKLFDSQNRSAFLQLAGVDPEVGQQMMFSTGVAPIYWPGGSEYSDITTVSGLPDLGGMNAIATPLATELSATCFALIHTAAPTSFGIQLFSVGQPAAGYQDCYWLALNYT